MNHAPQVRQATPPSDAVQAQWAQQREDDAARRQAQQDADRPIRRAMIQAQVQAGVALADIAAAVDCYCGCHTSLGGLHEQGAACPCQLSPAESIASRREALTSLMDLFRPTPEQEQAAEQEQAQFDALAAKLGVSEVTAGGAAPFTITGVVDGRAFYLRARHETYRIEVAPDEDPLRDPMRSSPYEATIEIASGDEDELGDTCRDRSTALRVTVGAVRTFLRQRNCEHPETPGARYCSMCGFELLPAYEPDSPHQP